MLCGMGGVGTWGSVNLLKPTGHVMHQQFNIQQLYTLCPHCIYVFCIYLRTNSDLCHLQHKLIGFYNRDEKFLQRGMDWVFKISSLPFALKKKIIIIKKKKLRHAVIQTRVY